jgi:hypothetical protein
MTNAPDAELLEQFARNQSEAAFAELVERLFYPEENTAIGLLTFDSPDIILFEFRVRHYLRAFSLL